MSYENNEYAYRILLEFDRELDVLPNEIVGAFKVNSEELEYVGGPQKAVSYPIEKIDFPLPRVDEYKLTPNVSPDSGILEYQGIIQLKPLEV